MIEKVDPTPNDEEEMFFKGELQKISTASDMVQYEMSPEMKDQKKDAAAEIKEK
jgi:hypothetical protein